MFSYIILIVVLLILEIVFLKLAPGWSLVDNPNHRSSHSGPTVRGGGFVIPVAALFYLLLFSTKSLWVSISLLLILVIGILDDAIKVSGLIRILVQAVAIGLILFSLDLDFTWQIFLLIIILTGALNATNFMDGINGITALYGLVMIIALYYTNLIIPFIDVNLLGFTLMGLIVFSFFNVRKKAKCFAGDVGSTGLGIILIYATVKLILVTGNPIYILLWALYGIDTVVTIVYRLFRREDIFKAHRQHLYQYLTNEKGHPHLQIALLYASIQMVINIAIIVIAFQTNYNQWLMLSGLLVVMGLIYVTIRFFITKSLNPQKATS